MRGLRFALLLVVALELAVWESFLVAARPFGHAVPLAALLAVVGNAYVGLTGARVLGRPLGAAVPAVLWLAVALELAVQRPEGDLVVPGTGRGLAFLVAGSAAAAVAAGLAGAGQKRATPEGDSRR